MPQNPFAKLFGVAPDPMQMYGSIASNPLAAQLLERYGLQMPQVSQNVFLPETGFFGSHPRVTRGIENALLAMANTEPSRTMGEGISNVARSVLGVQPMREQIMMSKLMAPFAMAKQLQDMQVGQANLEQMQAHANYYNGRAQVEARDYAKYTHFDVDEDGYAVGVTRDGAVERLLRDGQPYKPQGANGENAGTELERFISGEGWQRANQKRKLNGLPELSYDEWRKEAYRLIGSKAGAAAAGRNSAPPAPGSLNDQQEAELRDAEKAMNMKYQDFVVSNMGGDTSMDAYNAYKIAAQQRRARILQGGSPQAASPMGTSRTTAAAPAQSSSQDAIANEFTNLIKQAQTARNLAKNPQRFLAPGTPQPKPAWQELFDLQPTVKTNSFPVR